MVPDGSSDKHGHSQDRSSFWFKQSEKYVEDNQINVTMILSLILNNHYLKFYCVLSNIVCIFKIVSIFV